MKIYYCSGSTLPSSSANSVHVMKMCEAWGKAGHDVTLFAKGRTGPEVYEFYGVDPCFKIAAAPDLKIPVIGGLARVIHTCARGFLSGKADLAYGRDPLALFFMRGHKTVFEAHQVFRSPLIRRLGRKYRVSVRMPRASGSDHSVMPRPRGEPRRRC